MTTHFSRSLHYAGIDAATAYATVSQAPLPEVFAQRSGPFPPVVDVTEQVGEWAREVGQSRRIHTSDGGSVLETLTEVDAPHTFAYRLSEIAGPMKLLVGGLDGRWSCTPEGDGTRVAWTWDVDASIFLTAPLLPVLRAFWKPYAAHALAAMDAMARA